MSNTPVESQLPEVLGEDDLKRYQRILSGILERRSMLNPADPNMGTVFFQEKIGVLTLENGIYEISVDGHGRAKIFPDGSVMGAFESLTQWLVLADEAASVIPTLSVEEVLEYSNTLIDIHNRLSNDASGIISLSYEGKSGTLKFIDDRIIMRIEGMGASTIFLDGYVEGDATTFVSWFSAAYENVKAELEVFSALKATSIGVDESLKDK